MHGLLAELHSQAGSPAGKDEIAAMPVLPPFVVSPNEWPYQAPRTSDTNNNGPDGAVVVGVTWGG